MFLSEFSIKNPVLVIVLMIALVLFGVMGVKKMGIELFPNNDLPIMTVVAIYPGADAQTVENDVVKMLEDSVSTLSFIKHLESFSYANVGQLIVTCKDGTDIDVASQDIRDKLSRIQMSLPNEVEPPTVEKLDLQAIPVISLAMRVPSGTSPAAAAKVAETMIKDKLQNIEGVGTVNMYGSREKEIKVLLNPLTVNEYKMPMLSFVQLLKSSFIEIPAGNLKMNNSSEDIMLKVKGRLASIDAIRKSALINLGPNKLRVEDVATVEDALEEEESAAQVGLNPVIALQVQKQGGANVVKMAHEVKRAVADIVPRLPKGYALDIVSDNSPFIERTISSSMEELFFGAVLAALIVFLFLRNVRASFIVALSLPVSILGTFFVINAMGYTLNLVTALAFSLAIGLMVDDVIVIIENIFRHLEMGKTRLRASLDATKELGFAVISVSLTVIAVFLPFIYMKGIVGKMILPFGVTVCVAVILSLFMSLTLVPLFSSRMLKEESKNFFIYRWIEKGLRSIENKYAVMIGFVLRHKLPVFLLALLIACGGFALAPYLKQNLLDETDKGEFDIHVVLPGEASLEQGRRLAEEIVRKMEPFDWKTLTFTTIGGGTSKEKNKLIVKVRMKPLKERTVGVAQAIEETRTILQPLKEAYHADISVFAPGDAGSAMSNAALQFSVSGNNEDLLRRDTTRLIDYMKQEGSFTDITTSDKGLRKELDIELDHERMSELGVNAAETAILFRYLFNGEKISDYKEGGDMYEIKTYLDPAYRNLDTIRNISLRGANNQTVRLGDIAEVRYGVSAVVVNRLDRARIVKVEASFAHGEDLGGQIKKIEAFATQNFDKGSRILLTGKSEIIGEVVQSFVEAILVALILIYIVLASRFNSFVHPLTIMSALPFAVIGAFATLYFTGMSLSMMSFIGIMLLIALVNKNAILLVDFTLQRIGEGVATADALMQAGKARLRPIIMTMFATIFGMIPVALASGEGAEIKHPMAWSVMGGVIFSTLITLFLVPVIFSFFERFGKKESVPLLEVSGKEAE